MIAKRKWQRKGAVLPYIIIIFFIGTVIAGAIYSYSSTNIKQTISQQKNTMAYYCTLTGINMASGALLTDRHSLFDEFSNPAVPKAMDEWISVPVNEQYDPNKSNAHIEITNNATKRDTATGAVDGSGWVQVKVTGTYIDGGGKPTTNVGSVYYRMDNPFIFEQQLDAVDY